MILSKSSRKCILNKNILFLKINTRSGQDTKGSLSPQASFLLQVHHALDKKTWRKFCFFHVLSINMKERFSQPFEGLASLLWWRVLWNSTDYVLAAMPSAVLDELGWDTVTVRVGGYISLEPVMLRQPMAYHLCLSSKPINKTKW